MSFWNLPTHPIRNRAAAWPRPESERRTSHRVIYAGDDAELRPDTVFKGTQAEVLDLSERGMRVLCPRQKPPKRGEFVRLSVQFTLDDVSNVSGKVIRVGQDDFALSLSQGFSSSIIAREHMFLLDPGGNQ